MSDDENEFRSGLLTGLAYLLGAFFPLVPYFFASNAVVALAMSLALAGFALATVAAAISMFSGISLRAKALEMIIAAFAAAAVSFGFGKLLQVFTGVTM